MNREEEDDETIEWEQEQLRRSGHLGDATADEAPVKQVYKPAPSGLPFFLTYLTLILAAVPTPTPLPTLGPAVVRLAQTLSTLTVSHASSTTGLTALAQERQQLEEREHELREMVRNSEAKRSWFNAMKGWVESVAEFLDEKVGDILCQLPLSLTASYVVSST